VLAETGANTTANSYLTTAVRRLYKDASVPLAAYSTLTGATESMMKTWPSSPVGDSPFHIDFSSDALVVYIADFIRAGLSYTQAEGILCLNKDIPDVGWRFRSMSRHEISDQVSALCGLYFECLHRHRRRRRWEMHESPQRPGPCLLPRPPG
jgi:hypothetical protein